MRSNISTSKITGIVALSYLVLIPAGLYYLWHKVNIIDQDVIALCDHAGLKVSDVTPIDSVRRRVKDILVKV